MEKILAEFSKYERARILGARALQISMDAPILLKIDKEKLIEMNFDPLRIAEMEFQSGILPISIKRPMPIRTEEKIEKLAIEKEEREEKPDEEKIEREEKEETEIAKEGEIMEIAAPDQEFEEMEEPDVVGEAEDLGEVA